MTNECYEFTWLGPVEDNINNTRSCDDLVLSNPSLVTLPCFEPLVFTQGEYRLEGPNLTEIEQQCKAAETTDGSLCTPLCDLQVGLKTVNALNVTVMMKFQMLVHMA